MDATFESQAPAVQWLWAKLGLADRIVGTTGWLVRATRTYRHATQKAWPPKKQTLTVPAHAKWANRIDFKVSVGCGAVRFDRLVTVDVDPLFACGPQNGKVPMPVFLRGSLRPIQAALGIIDRDTPELVVWAGRGRGVRAVDPNRKAAIFEVINDWIRAEGLALQIHEFRYDGRPEQAFSLFRRAAVVVGPHGGTCTNWIETLPVTVVLPFVFFQ